VTIEHSVVVAPGYATGTDPAAFVLGPFVLATITTKGFPIVSNFTAVDDITTSVIVDSVPVP
jgi:hypothetical protein